MLSPFPLHSTLAESPEEVRKFNSTHSRLPRPVVKAAVKEPVLSKELLQEKPHTVKARVTAAANSVTRPRTRSSNKGPSKETPRGRIGTGSVARTKSKTAPHKRIASRTDDRDTVSRVQELLADKVMCQGNSAKDIHNLKCCVCVCVCVCVCQSSRLRTISSVDVKTEQVSGRLEEITSQPLHLCKRIRFSEQCVC